MISAVLSLVLCGGPAAARPEPLRLSRAEARAEKAIRARDLAADIRYLASDALEGRAPGSRGDGLAQAYIAETMKRLGLEPGAPGGGYVQELDLVGVTGHPDQLVAEGSGGSVALDYRRDFMAVAGEPAPESRLEGAELVFVGFGIVAPEFQWDDYKGADLAGKVMLVMNGDPEDDPAIFGGKARLWYGRWDYKYEMAARLGAAGVLIVHTTPSAGYPWSVVQSSWGGEQLSFPSRARRAPVEGWVTEDAARRLALLGGWDLDALRLLARRRAFRPAPLGVRLTTSFHNELETRRTANVIGALRGADPVLAGEAVLFTAHHDHLGKDAGAGPGQDAIYNGALDNASGVAAMLAVARAFLAMPSAPRRSVYFAAVAAEEQGLLGSKYMAEHPPVPLRDMAAVVNIDGANVWGPTRDVALIGYGRSSLDAVVRRVAAMQGRTVKPDPLPDRGFFYRSDQFSFARGGVPAVYAESGMDVIGRPKGWGRARKRAWEAKRYHQPSDEFDPAWDLRGAVEDARLYFHVARLVANADAMPRWNPGDEFEAARAAAGQDPPPLPAEP